MNIKEILKNKKVLISLAVTVLIIVLVIFIFNNRNDGMAQGGVVKTYYKVFTKEKARQKPSLNIRYHLKNRRFVQHVGIHNA